METFKKNNDKLVFCITAKSFPDGVKEAHEKLHALLPMAPGREYYGISFGSENNGIVYKAAVGLKNPEEGKKFNLEEFIIRKGNYSGVVVKDFMKDMSSIGRTFQQLLDNSDIDPLGYCLEEYINNDVRCLVKTKDK